MKSSLKSIKKRQASILSLLEKNTSLAVPDLAEKIGVSEITIRRDLSTLEKMALIRRFHGGAELVAQEKIAEKSGLEDIKAVLAQKAAEFIQENDTVFINTSTTALKTVQYLGDKRVNIITNNVKIANLDHNPNTTVILSGGEIRFPKEALVGDIAIDSFSKMKADICIIGCTGIDPEEGITTPILHEAKINSLIIERTTGLKIVVADYRKIGVAVNFLSSSLTNINYLITDTFADQEIIHQIEKKGVIVIQIPQ